MKNIFLVLLFTLFISKLYLAFAAPIHPLVYEVNLNDRADDLFKVTLQVKGLTKANAIYQFAVTAPGTYQIMDMGRYIRSFHSFDKDGRELKAVRLSTNQWQLSQPEKVRQIQYTIAETWDKPVTDHQIFTMCGTSLEEDHVLLNGQAVFGFPTGMQTLPILLKLHYPSDWNVGTALEKNAGGYYMAHNYDHLADSPILAGNLSTASLVVAGTQVDLYAYSQTGKIQAGQLLHSMETMLQAARHFLRQLPVNRYTFLFHFGDQNGGGWEHNYSSGYVIKEEMFTNAFAERITYLATHEFLHIVTPLHIHSEVIAPFNFVIPTPSQHLWLYEGVTEWASHMMPLRGEMIDLDTYLNRLSKKVEVDKSLDTTMSLSKISLACYLPQGQQQSWNVYNRGALLAGLLDIRLLELSGGRRGLREVITELIKKYGRDKPFPENEFFTLLVEMTYPEIADFLNRYVRNAEPLPFTDYYSRLGICYIPALATGRKTSFLGVKFEIVAGKLLVSNLSKALQQAGLQVQDQVVKLNNIPLDLATPQGIAYYNSLMDQLKKRIAGQTYYLTIRRNNKEETIVCPILEQEEIKNYVFQISSHPTPEQLHLRSIWLKNL
ncbi:peptidase [Xanthocytophaga agilis]|uniref:Peptidase n=1 Tax=Xanthocytophaga agilis TaxID=3048010 RepID=A0AAE3R5A4_9BACT|nr:peptidase [Xanthocytophaga agilis]MDJ1501610.1 peptidase [Xanthocytophaga agilis]